MTKRTLPGNWDALKMLDRYPSDNTWGIPALYGTAEIPGHLCAYCERIRGSYDLSKIAAHFFLDDFRFERVWNSPRRSIGLVSRFGYCLTPDFSLFRDWPLAAQLWNTYRTRWMGAYWQASGLRVIPTLSWSTPESYGFAWSGVPRQSVVAVSTVGSLTEPEASALFESGYRAMIGALDPAAVVVYGSLPKNLRHLAKTHEYSTRWQQIRERLARERRRPALYP